MRIPVHYEFFINQHGRCTKMKYPDVAFKDTLAKLSVGGEREVEVRRVVEERLLKSDLIPSYLDGYKRNEWHWGTVMIQF